MYPYPFPEEATFSESEVLKHYVLKVSEGRSIPYGLRSFLKDGSPFHCQPPACG